MAKKEKHVRVIVDGEKQNFPIVGKTKKGATKIHQNEGLFTSEFVEAVRKLGRWPKDGETIGENSKGTPCVVDAEGYPATRGS